MHRPALIRAAFGKYVDFLSTSYPLVSMSGIFLHIIHVAMVSCNSEEWHQARQTLRRLCYRARIIVPLFVCTITQFGFGWNTVLWRLEAYWFWVTLLLRRRHLFRAEEWTRIFDTRSQSHIRLQATIWYGNTSRERDTFLESRPHPQTQVMRPQKAKHASLVLRTPFGAELPYLAL